MDLLDKELASLLFSVEIQKYIYIIIVEAFKWVERVNILRKYKIQSNPQFDLHCLGISGQNTKYKIQNRKQPTV